MKFTQTIKKVLFILSPSERKSALFLLIMIIIMALLEMVGVASILPFMTVLTNPSLIETNFILNRMFQVSHIFGVEDSKQFVLALGIMVFIFLIISLTFKALTTYMQIRFIQMCNFSISKRMVEGYLNHEYSWFLSRHSAELGKGILSEVSQVNANGIGPLLELMAKGIVTIALVILLVIADPKLALIVGLALGGSYLLFFYIVKNYLNHIGEDSLKYNELRYKSVSEAFGAVKEIKVGGLEKFYVKAFSNAAQIHARMQAIASIIAQLPRFILEAVAFGGILLLIFYIIAQTGSLNDAIPIISLYVFAGYRLMPALQQIYASFTKVTFVGPSLDKLHSDIKNLKKFNEDQDQGIIPFNKKITLNNIKYHYPNSSRIALRDISLSIPAKSMVGLVGSTGSGKTTIADIILGLLEPQKGTLEVDGQIISKYNVRSWQRSIGYVPQHIYLSDDTIAANIAFGIEYKKVNIDAIEKAAKIANLHQFVIDELPKQYQTKIGERGVRLSGGQRQRIGIARALYHNPKVLILDEATSALDNQTEKAVMDSINNIGKNITIILIAHRLDTIKKCDIIFELNKGQLIGKRKFDELINDNK